MSPIIAYSLPFKGTAMDRGREAKNGKLEIEKVGTHYAAYAERTFLPGKNYDQLIGIL